MRRALLDVNVLLALAWPNHQHHGSAHRWFAKEGRLLWATCALTQLGFVRLSANPAYTTQAVSPAAALSLLQGLAAHAAHEFWDTCPPLHADALARAAGHRQVNDAYLLHLAATHKGRLATFDAGLRAHAPHPDALCLIAVSPP